MSAPHRTHDTDRDGQDADDRRSQELVEETSVDTDALDPHVDTVLNGRYRVERKLGRGGHGLVYAGTQIGTERKVAIKLLRPESIDDPEIEGRFRHEGLVMCSLRSAHTIVTYDIDQTDQGILYIVMEQLDGRTLREVGETDAPLHWKRVLDIVMQTAEALIEAHSHGIVHRDLKPANIILETRPGNPDFVKVLDFGIAKILEGEPLGLSTIPKLTARGQTVGTLRYMSPEQLMGTRLDGRSDIYSLGVVAYELLTRQVPFPDARKPAKLIAAQLRRDPEPPSAVHPDGGIPEAVDALVLRMLAKETELRLADAEALVHACEQAVHTWPGSAPVPTPHAHAAPTSGHESGHIRGAAGSGPDSAHLSADMSARTPGSSGQISGPLSSPIGAYGITAAGADVDEDRPTTRLPAQASASYPHLDPHASMSAIVPLPEDIRVRARLWPWLVVIALVIAGVVAVALAVP